MENLDLNKSADYYYKLCLRIATEGADAELELKNACIALRELGHLKDVEKRVQEKTRKSMESN